MPRIVLALGGNALLRRGDPPDERIQVERLGRIAPAIARMAHSWQVIIVHGNGPQVGLLATENQTDRTLASPYPLSDMVAETQGLIGGWIQAALAGEGCAATALITHTRVAADDPAFGSPTKFVGPVCAESEAERLTDRFGWTFHRDGDDWRRVVPSPEPAEILGLNAAELLAERGTVVILAGGGGIPLAIGPGGHPHPVDAVIDKDLTAARVAIDLAADRFVIATDVPGVYRDYPGTERELIHQITPDELESLTLPSGSMGPKAQAACRYVDATGHTAVIAALDHIEEAARLASGTLVRATPTAEQSRPPAGAVHR
ncbi:carbamate kinase [Leifsonia sp. LS1]|uniref:amino acid kinase family protein n=1 Tax=Leifsonia sp. LS1 TaxID=2828483 RepID=UPI001CFDD42F|nr:carbamate kinase [Leifsonia sp. LS1]GIT78393.1 carbamate kinase [Leifsonia sp. LS1]